MFSKEPGQSNSGCAIIVVVVVLILAAIGQASDDIRRMPPQAQDEFICAVLGAIGFMYLVRHKISEEAGCGVFIFGFVLTLFLSTLLYSEQTRWPTLGVCSGLVSAFFLLKRFPYEEQTAEIIIKQLVIAALIGVLMYGLPAIARYIIPI